MKDTVGEESMGMNMKVGADDVSIVQKRNQTKNASLAEPKNATALAEPKNTTSLAQTKNPVVNPPFNNWSVNQPSPPHAHGLAGKADLGQNIIVDGHRVHF